MTKKKLFAGVMCLSLCTILVVPIIAGAQQDPRTSPEFGTFKAELGIPAAAPTLERVVAKIIKTLLGFLGIIAVIIILWGGFTWMTAGGNTEKVESAQKILTAGIIGLVIVLAAWAIAEFVINMIYGAITTPQ